MEILVTAFEPFGDEKLILHLRLLAIWKLKLVVIKLID